MTKKTWKLDPLHSEVQFKVKHLVISTVTGSFKNFDATLHTFNDSFENAEIKFEASIDSIETGNQQRDGHLKSDDFFNADKFPKLLFNSSKISKLSEHSFQLDGNLTIRDVTQNVSLTVIHGGTMVDPYGQTKSGFEVEGKINRKTFGLKWDGVTEAGGIVVSDEVRLICNVQFILQAN